MVRRVLQYCIPCDSSHSELPQLPNRVQDLLGSWAFDPLALGLEPAPAAVGLTHALIPARGKQLVPESAVDLEEEGEMKKEEKNYYQGKIYYYK